MSEMTKVEKQLGMDFSSLPERERTVLTNVSIHTLQIVIDDLSAELHATSSNTEKLMLSNLIARYLQLRIKIQERARA